MATEYIYKVIPEEEFEELKQQLTSIDAKLNSLISNVKLDAREEEFLTRVEVAKMLRVTNQTLIAWHKNGVLPRIRIGTRIRYRLSDIQNFQP